MIKMYDYVLFDGLLDKSHTKKTLLIYGMSSLFLDRGYVRVHEKWP